MNQSEKLLIGSEEWCAFPQLGIPAIKARVDSGAKTSALHAVNLQLFKRAGRSWVSFEVHPLQGNRRTLVRCEAEVVDRRSVKSSSGDTEKRLVIRTTLALGGGLFEVELTLTNRDSMGYRMLLGREAMVGRMLVDPAHGFLLGDLPTPELELRYQPLTESTREGLKIAVLADDPKLYSNVRLVEAGEERGHSVQVLNPKHCYIRLDADKPEIHYRGGRLLDPFNAVVPRLPRESRFYGCALLRQFESLGITCLNGASAITHASDKLYSLQLLLQSGLDIPVTGFANSPVDTEDLIHMVGGAPLIIKLLNGSQGEGVVLAETRKAAESVINAFKSLQVNLLVQEYIQEARGSDLRLLVVDGRVVAAMERTAAAGDFRANLHRGASAKAIKASQAERKLAVRAARTLNLTVAGVDVIRSARGPLLLEVNACPGLEGIEAATGRDVAGTIIQAIERKLDWPRKLVLESVVEQ